MRALLYSITAAVSVISGLLRADEPFLRSNEVIALVGGEDMVAAAEYGYLELLLTRALPEHRLKFRCLAWEGDTVFEQRRDLNFPTWEEQLEKIGATVVICQFGQMESLAGKEKLPEFVAAYEKLIARFSGGGKRRVVLLTPTPFEGSGIPGLPREEGIPDLYPRDANFLRHYVGGVQKLASDRACVVVELFSSLGEGARAPRITRDGSHLTDYACGEVAESVHLSLRAPSVSTLPFTEDRELRQEGYTWLDYTGRLHQRYPIEETLLATIRAKNRLWDRYWRPQNWAFLAGDRTTQASSRDHLDPSKRWFPAEREEFLPLIEKKEQEIWALAQQLAKADAK